MKYDRWTGKSLADRYASYIKRCLNQNREVPDFDTWHKNHLEYKRQYQGKPKVVRVVRKGERIPCLGHCGGMIVTTDKKTHRMCSYCASRRH